MGGRIQIVLADGTLWNDGETKTKALRVAYDDLRFKIPSTNRANT